LWIDESFNLSEATAKEYIQKAEHNWEEATGRELFYYDESASLKIDFIFDERQQTADSEENLRNDLDKKRDENEELTKLVDKLRSEHESLTRTYQADVSRYEERLSKYNAEVNKYNDRGGAPTDVFSELEEERKSLSREADDLTETVSGLNDLVEKINELGDKLNQAVEAYNREVNAYNEEFGFAREFTQGDYHDGNIRIYKFSNEVEVVGVLTHEFGHALGIGHVESEGSLMYYLLDEEAKSVSLSEDDLKAFYEVCGQNETLGQKVRSKNKEFYWLD
jgi:DNA repair exonuclease SbcCD ATPase subunit